MSVLRFVTGCVLVVSLTSCTGLRSVPHQKRAIALEASVQTYRKMMRWGHYDEAVKYVRQRDGVQTPPDLDHIARFRVTRYEAGNLLITDDGNEARSVAVIEYYELDSGVLHTIRDEQIWWYDAEEKRWYLGSSLPDFGNE